MNNRNCSTNPKRQEQRTSKFPILRLIKILLKRIQKHTSSENRNKSQIQKSPKRFTIKEIIIRRIAASRNQDRNPGIIQARKDIIGFRAVRGKPMKNSGAAQANNRGSQKNENRPTRNQLLVENF